MRGERTQLDITPEQSSSKDWTHRQFVFARNRLLLAARQCEIALANDGRSKVELGLRAGFAQTMVGDASRELRRLNRRLDPPLARLSAAEEEK